MFPNIRITCLCILLVMPQIGLSNSPELSLKNLKPVGQASLKVLWFDIYDATLFTSSGRFPENLLTDQGSSTEQKHTPIALELVYKRNISRESLIAETKKQLKGKLDEHVLSSSLEQLASIWPDIETKDALAFYLEHQNLGHFYHNNQYLGSIDTENFSRAFLDIWIGQDSPFPKLANQLKGL